MELHEMFWILWPLLVIQVMVQIYALVNLWSVNKGKTRNLTNYWWTVIIVLGELLGPIIYFIFGSKKR